MRILQGFFALLALLSVIPVAYGVSEQNYHETMVQEVLPDIRAHATHRYLDFQGLKLSYLHYENSQINSERGPVVISPGRGESIVDYYEFVYDLAKLGYGPLFVLDHRGQGFSSRMLPDRQKGYVRHFYDYNYDLQYFINNVVRKHTDAKITLIGHSMGGLIATLYMIEAPEAAEVVSRTILITPMFGIDLGMLNGRLSRTLLRSLCIIGKCNSYAFGVGPHKFKPYTPDNIYTTSQARYDFGNYQLEKTPEIALGGPTNRWLLESLNAIRRGRRYSHRIQVPTTVVYSSEDQRVEGSEAPKFCRLMQNCRSVNLPLGRHLLHQERDEIRDALIQNILWSGRP